MRSLLDLGDAALATEVLAAAPHELADQVTTADVTTLVKSSRRIITEHIRIISEYVISGITDVASLVMSSRRIITDSMHFTRSRHGPL